MLDNNFADYLKSIRPVNPLITELSSDNLLWKVVPWLIGIMIVTLIFAGIDSTLVECVALGVVAIMLWVESKLDHGFLKSYLKRVHLIDVQWLCLKCKQHWVEIEDRSKA